MAKKQERSSPGDQQRLRCGIAACLALLTWGLRWLWPFQLIPGWLVTAMLAWALIELATLLLAPRRWS